MAAPTRARLHDEILPPPLPPESPRARRNARRALAVIGLLAIIVELGSTPVGHALNAIARSGTDPYSIWQRYTVTAVPDVLILGASPARTDIDEPALSSALSVVVGHHVSVEKMGFAGQSPLLLDAVMYRVMKRSPRPKLLVFAFQAPLLNGGCVCLGSTNAGLVDISDFSDPAFVRLALSLSPDPARLLLGWAVPALPYAQSIVALQCLAYNGARKVSTGLFGRIPRQLQNETACEATAAYKWGVEPEMTQSDYVGSVDSWRLLMYNFAISQQLVTATKDIITRAQSNGTRVIFWETPLQKAVRSLYPGEDGSYESELAALSKQFQVPVVDDRASVPDEAALWVDALHLNRSGSDYISPSLARSLAPVLAG